MRELHQQDRFAGAPLSSPWMRMGVLVSFLSMLFLIVLFEIPFAGTFPHRPGGETPRAGSAPRCLRLAYGPGVDSGWMPTAVRLHAKRYRVYDALAPAWFEADGKRGSAVRRLVTWRPAGPDSIDVVWHHSPVLRIPVRGASRVGRGGWSEHASIFSLVANQDFAVRAREFPCASQEWPAG